MNVPVNHDRAETTPPRILCQSSSFRQLVRYRFPILLFVIAAASGATFAYYLVQVRTVERQFVEAQNQDQTTREQITREAKGHPEDPNNAIAQMLVSFGANPELDALSRQRSIFERKEFQALGICIPAASIGLLWLLFLYFAIPVAKRSLAAAVSLTVISFGIALASYLLFLWHLWTSWLDFETAFPFFAGALFPLLLLKPAPVWVGGIQVKEAWTLLLIAGGIDLIVIAVLYSFSDEPLGILMGINRSDLREDWYSGIALTQWALTLGTLGLAWCLAKSRVLKRNDPTETISAK